MNRRPKPRDPRMDPQCNDRVTVGDETRVVISARGGRVTYGWADRVAVRSMSLADWQRWAAKVVA